MPSLKMNTTKFQVEREHAVYMDFRLYARYLDWRQRGNILVQ